MLLQPGYHMIQFTPDRFYIQHMKTISNEIFFAQVESEILAGRSVRFKVKGSSMYPMLRDGKDEVTLSPLNSPPNVNDIVLFRYRGKHVLHRIIAFDGNTYTIQGDGIYMSCETCKLEDIVGTVTQIHKKGKAPIGTTSQWVFSYIFFWQNLRFFRRYLLAILRRVYK